MSDAPESSRRRRVRLLVIPAALLLGVSATAFALAQTHLAKPGLPKTTGPVSLGDPYQGQVVFSQTCAPCHGTDGKGGGIGPKLQGLDITLARAKAQIDAGGGAMPGGLVSGTKEENVLAYLSTILAKPS